MAGDHVYLGLVLSDREYAKTTPTHAPFTALTHLLSLTLRPNTTSVEALHAREIYTEQTRLYRECKNVEKALLRHVHTTLEEKYIEHLLDEDTGLLKNDIWTVMEYLFKNYKKH